MLNFGFKKRRLSAVVLLFIFLLFPISVFAIDPATATAVSGAQQEAVCQSAPFAPPCIGESIKDVALLLQERVSSPTWKIALVQGLLDISKFVTQRLAYEAALIVANGGVGQGSMFYKKGIAEGFKDFGLEVAGEAVAELSEGLESGFGLKLGACLPPPDFTLALQLGIAQRYKPQKPRCDILDVLDNWGDFVGEIGAAMDPDQANKAIISKFAESMRPGANELSSSVKLNYEISRATAEEKERIIQQQLKDDEGIKDVKDTVTKKTTTPSSVVSQDFLNKIKMLVTGEETKLDAKSIMETNDPSGTAISGLAMTAASTFTNTLLSELFNKIYKGLFDVSPESSDPFNLEALPDDEESQRDRLSGIFATLPFAKTEYNVLSEFITCPPEGIANRGINNCVMNADLMAAISRGSSGAPLTVQEAIDEGLLSGGWKLISSRKLDVNQDPLCYTYAFCYGNLVKLRKARILPIGWELAAQANSDTNPKTLQEIVNEFDSCSPAGTIDVANPFCHLIDPNWVLKYPDTQCRATVNGEIKLTMLSPGRQSVCADAPSCLGEDQNGKCTDGYGYCVSEKNVWKFKGDACEEQYAGCLSMANTTTQKQNAFIINTVDYSICGKQNAGCQWYRTNQYKSGDKFEWLLSGDDYNTSEREDDWRFQKSNGSMQGPETYLSGVNAYSVFSYEDRQYFTHAAEECSQSDAGCSELFSAKDSVLNMVRDPSFETDENSDGVPDHWVIDGTGFGIGDVVIESTKQAARGTKSVKLLQEGFKGLSQLLPIEENQFHTLSFYAISETQNAVTANIRLKFYDDNGDSVSLSGLSVVGCEVTNDFTLTAFQSVSSEWQRHSCTFGVPENTSQIKVLLDSTNVRFDAIQLEPKETTSQFADGLSTNSQANFIRVAPDYLGCEGKTTDPSACASYAPVCASQDVGCNKYTPDDGDPDVTAIVSSLDSCPSECVGYDTFKQEETLYDDEDFPLFFIPEKAASCSAQFIGCDSFTNLDILAEGGEGIEYYTNLRACATPGMLDGSSTNKESSAFFTWEGSDNAGYQLRSWTLLESNQNDAPCTKWKVSDKDQLVCDENAAYVSDASCDDHSDIFTNPDCREFYDSAGKFHFRKFSQTVTVSDECSPYRKDVSTLADCDSSGGFWDLQVGFCRYFGLSSESNSCPAAQNGCRSYTGGAGRNAVTLLNETFESGSYSGYAAFGATNTDVKISNESIATDGHSIRVKAPATGKGGFKTVQEYLNSAHPNDTFYDPNDSKTTCSDLKNPVTLQNHIVTPAGCEVAPDCVVYPGENSCGPLVNKLVSGKTFVVQFLAKGNGDLDVLMIENGGAGTAPSYEVGETISLTGGWKTYTLGPFDSSQFPGIDKNAILVFQTTTANTEFYIDNLILKQAEENITIIKDSWVVPSTCDIAPNGAITPQYYLGCEAYSDKDGVASNLYQFSNLCSEKVVGCDAFYKTAESDSAYQQTFNARCALGTGGDLSLPAYVNQNTACTVGGITYCTISKGRSYCVFDYDGTFGDKLPIDGNFGIVYGPETVIAPADRAVYIVDNGKNECGAGAAGCREVGKPKYSQDLKKVDGFESAYFINDPESYGDILCDNEALFCEEFASTKDGNFYFKDPLKKTCEYRAGVEIEGQKFTGWFRAGTSEPCYWTDTDSDGMFKPKTDNAYIVAGDQVSIWKNGDPDYDGWVGSCSSSSDLCTEFADAVDNEEPYFFLNNDKLDEAATADPDVCQGRVSQKLGCAVFNNRSKSELKYNASASYVASIHADVLLNKSPNALVDPVSCTLPDSDKFIVSESAKETLGLSSTTVNLCQRRCVYKLDANDSLETNLSVKYNSTDYVERSCLVVDDCPTLETKNGKEVKALSCNIFGNYKLNNDSNSVLRVNRDRSCDSWLACDSARTSWNERTNKYEKICDSINLCEEGSALGDETTCTDWSPRDPEILTAYKYSSRDITWSGFDLSGYAVPNKLPVELYNQFNIAPSKACKSDSGWQLKDDLVVSCDVDADCDSYDIKENGIVVIDYTCQTGAKGYRLVNDAGPCDADADLGSSCQVGFCEDGGEACGTSDDCASGDNCVIGSCQATAVSGDTAKCGTDGDCSCVSDLDCGGNYVCDKVTSLCVDQQLGVQKCYAADNNNCVDPQVCVPKSTTAFGSCYNGRCLTSIIDTDNNGFADPLKSNNWLLQSCRGYPEVDSPFPSKIVEKWATPNGTTENKETGFAIEDLPSQQWSKPYTYKTGYNDSQVCAPKGDDKVSGCICSYDKVEYADGALNRYEAIGTSQEILPKGICKGGLYDGHFCESDSDCANPDNILDSGSCLKQTRRDTLFGWEGYCIEKDTSIQLYASTEENDQACLTWLPVDQLSGATDLYAKYTSAGYEPQDTYFCGDIQVAYDFSSNGYHCAETDGGNCDDEASTDAFQDDDPDEDTYCAPGSFVIMAPCGDPSPNDKCTEWGDDDYPYFCVPELSYKTEDDEGGGLGMKIGDRCEVPGEDVIIYSGSEDENGNTIYFMHAEDWKDYRTSYNDCAVRGVFEVSNTYKAYFSNGGTDGIFMKPYLACQTIVQVGQQIPDLEGNYNAAWTDRVWKSDPTPYKIGSVGKDFTIEDAASKYAAITYGLNTEPEIFGQAFSLSKKLDKDISPDPYPHRVFMCQDDDNNQKLAKPDDSSCPDNDDYEGYAVDPEIGEARPYYAVEMSTDSSTDSSLCQNVDCSCDSHGECNYTNGAPTSCENLVCQGGTFDDEACDETFGKQADVIDPETGEMYRKECDDLPNNTDKEKAEKALCYQDVAEKACEDQGGGTCVGECVNGGAPGAACEKIDDCRTQLCYTNTYFDKNTNTNKTTSACSKKGQTTPVANETPAKDFVVPRLQQLFANVYDLKKFVNDGIYTTSDTTEELVADYNTLESNSYSLDPLTGVFQSFSKPEFEWDTRDEVGTPPHIVSLGPCVGTKCKEGEEGKFTVNDQDSGDILAKGSKRTTVSFFTYADPNQMPIRNIIVDWGDGQDITAGGMPWPTDSQSGSNASDNFYKNHRGLNEINGNNEETCRADADVFGESPEACSSGYVVFSHDYSCSNADINKLTSQGRDCEYFTDGRLKNSPCLESTKDGKQACVFQPRVHVKDNWGWCTGFCDAGSDGKDGCYAGGDPEIINNECQISVCPSEGKNDYCPDKNVPGKVVNPWVNYDGTIIVEVE